MNIRASRLLKFLRVLMIVAILAAALLPLRRREVPARAVATTVACGIAFETLAGWALADTSTQAHGCTIRLDTRDSALLANSSIIGEFEVIITVRQGATDSISTEEGFVHRDTGWVVMGRMGMESAAIEYGRGEWRGVQGVAEVGCSSRVDSTYAGLCDMSRAVIGDGRMVLSIDAGPGGAEAFQRVLMTLRAQAR